MVGNPNEIANNFNTHYISAADKLLNELPNASLVLNFERRRETLTFDSVAENEISDVVGN